MATLRPDLVLVDPIQLTPYLAPRILPPRNVMQKIGNQYYVTVDADVSAQTGRSLGAAPTATTLASMSDTFTTVEYIKDVAVPDDEIKLMGGLQAAQEKAARIGKRSCLRALETAVFNLIQASCTGVDILGDLRGSIDTGMDSIQRYAGKTVLACGWTTFRRMTRYAEVTNTLLRTGVMASSGLAVRNVDGPTLATVLGVDEVLVGDDDHWTAGTAFLLRLPDASVAPDELPQLGRTIQYLPDNAQPFQIESFYSDALVAEYVRSRAWWDAEIYNAGACYILRGIDEGNAVTTSTSTTSTT